MVLELPHYSLSSLPKMSQHSLSSAMSVIPQRLALDEEASLPEDAASVVVVVIQGEVEVNSRE
jgi:hypothetical protein